MPFNFLIEGTAFRFSWRQHSGFPAWPHMVEKVSVIGRDLSMLVQFVE